MRFIWLVGISFISLAFAGCATSKAPIIAVAADDVGITAGVGAQNQGGNLTIGYRGAKFAVVPVQTDEGKRLALRNGSNREEGFSVFALLGVDAKGARSPSADIRQVVAVGPAADIWSYRASGVMPKDIKEAQDMGIIRKK